MEKIVTKITDKIIDGLKTAALELEEFQLQFALGKAEALDKYEEVKEKMNAFLIDIKEKIKSEEKTTDLKGTIESLQALLILGKAETKELFDEQKKLLLKVLHEMEETIKANDIGLSLQSLIRTELTKFKIKLEIINLRFALKEINLKENIKKNKQDFFESIDRIKNEFSAKDCSQGNNRTLFCNELNQAYLHLKKAFGHA